MDNKKLVNEKREAYYLLDENFKRIAAPVRGQCDPNKRGKNFSRFIGHNPEQVAKKLANRGMTDIRIRKAYSRDVHHYRGWVEICDKPRIMPFYNRRNSEEHIVLNKLPRVEKIETIFLRKKRIDDIDDNDDDFEFNHDDFYNDDDKGNNNNNNKLKWKKFTPSNIEIDNNNNKC